MPMVTGSVGAPSKPAPVRIPPNLCRKFTTSWRTGPVDEVADRENTSTGLESARFGCNVTTTLPD